MLAARRTTPFGRPLGAGPLWLPWLVALPKRRVFVSYHDDDLPWYTSFSRVFDDRFDVVQDRSLDRLYGNLDSDPEYIIRMIREKHIAGTSCTVVLCGARTSQRKFVDWEICATLYQKHGLIGINLPTNAPSSDASGVMRYVVPGRLHDNCVTRYALWCGWQQLVEAPSGLARWIEAARSRPTGLIDNSRRRMRRNLSASGS